MKIAKVEAIPVSYPEPNDFNALRHLCLARITADDGQVKTVNHVDETDERGREN